MSSSKGQSKVGSVTRRQVVVGIAAASLTSVLPMSYAFASDPISGPLLKTSSFLTGIPLDKSYIQLSLQIWNALTVDLKNREEIKWYNLIDAIAALPDDATDAQVEKTLRDMGPKAVARAQKLARVWYTGKIKQDDGVVHVINYDEALVWRACDFTKPPLTCGGPFGYWAKPYEGGKSS